MSTAIEIAGPMPLGPTSVKVDGVVARKLPLAAPSSGWVEPGAAGGALVRSRVLLAPNPFVLTAAALRAIGYG